MINVTIVRNDASNTFFQADSWKLASEQAVKASADTFYAPGVKIFMFEQGVSSRPEEHTPASLNADLIDGNIPG